VDDVERLARARLADPFGIDEPEEGRWQTTTSR
jgi:hypothetical protein